MDGWLLARGRVAVFSFWTDSDRAFRALRTRRYQLISSPLGDHARAWRPGMRASMDEQADHLWIKRGQVYTSCVAGVLIWKKMQQHHARQRTAARKPYPACLP